LITRWIVVAVHKKLKLVNPWKLENHKRREPVHETKVRALPEGLLTCPPNDGRNANTKTNRNLVVRIINVDIYAPRVQTILLASKDKCTSKCQLIPAKSMRTYPMLKTSVIGHYEYKEEGYQAPKTLTY
jgi:hypothetical protein